MKPNLLYLFMSYSPGLNANITSAQAKGSPFMPFPVAFSKAPLPQGFSAVAISIKTQPSDQISASQTSCLGPLGLFTTYLAYFT